MIYFFIINGKTKHFPKPIFYFLIFNFIITFKLFFTSSKAYNNFFLNTEPAYSLYTASPCMSWEFSFKITIQSNKTHFVFK